MLALRAAPEPSIQPWLSPSKQASDFSSSRGFAGIRLTSGRGGSSSGGMAKRYRHIAADVLRDAAPGLDAPVFEGEGAQKGAQSQSEPAATVAN